MQLACESICVHAALGLSLADGQAGHLNFGPKFYTFPPLLTLFHTQNIWNTHTHTHTHTQDGLASYQTETAEVALFP